LALPIAAAARVIPQAVMRIAPMKGGLYGGTSGVRLEITNWNEVMKVLVKLDKTYVSAMRADFRRIAKSVQDEVRKGIPNKSNPPLSGMKQVHFGRLAWGSSYGKGAKPSKSVLIQTPNTRKRVYRGKDIAIARVQVLSPATVLADMAGRKGNARARKGLTPMYDYMYTINGNKVPGKRQHTVKPWNFVSKISGGKGIRQNWASRFIWPSAMKALPQVRRDVDTVITAANVKVNQLLRSL